MSAPETTELEAALQSSATLPTFFDNVDAFAETLGGVAKLRELILDLAVRGMLVAQDENDEPASELLNRIEAGREALIANGKLRRPRKEALLEEDNLPFLLPRGWAWVKLGRTMKKMGAGSTPLGGKRVYVDDGVMFLRSQNVWNDGLRRDDVARIPSNIHVDMSGTHVESGDVLLNITGASIGRCALVPDSFDQANVSQHVAILRLIDKNLRQFLHLCVVSPFFQETIMRVQVGVSREGLSMTRLKEFPFPVPPFSEQRRIVSKVDGLMSLCDELESRGSERVRLRERASRSCLERLVMSSSPNELASAWQRLSDHFEVLYDAPETLAHLRQSILQLAVQGKLVPQDPNDEPASELLERIQKERTALVKAKAVKRPKSLPPVTEDDAPFRPSGWKWARLGDVTDARCSISYGVLVPGPDVDDGVPFVRVQDLSVSNAKRRPNKTIARDIEAKYARTRLLGGEILLAVVGATIGKIGVAPSEWNGANIARAVCRIATAKELHRDYIVLVLLSDLVQQHYREVTRTLAQPTLNVSDIEKTPIPIPPLAEQKRIVAKVDQLLSQVDELSSQLQERQLTTQQLLTAIIHHLLDGVVK